MVYLQDVQLDRIYECSDEDWKKFNEKLDEIDPDTWYFDDRITEYDMDIPVWDDLSFDDLMDDYKEYKESKK